MRSMDARSDAMSVADQLPGIDILRSIYTVRFRNACSSFEYVSRRAQVSRVRRLSASRARHAHHQPARAPLSRSSSKSLFPHRQGRDSARVASATRFAAPCRIKNNELSSENQALEQTRDSVLRYGKSVGCELLNFS